MISEIFSKTPQVIGEIAQLGNTVKKGGSRPKRVALMFFGGPGSAQQTLTISTALRCHMGEHTLIMFERGLKTLCQADFKEEKWDRADQVPGIKLVAPDGLDYEKLTYTKSIKGVTETKSILLKNILDPRFVPPLMGCGRKKGIGKSKKKAALASKNLKHLDVDVVIMVGGDGTLRCVEFWSDECHPHKEIDGKMVKTPIVCIALTIDQNLELPRGSMCVGHLTFVNNLIESGFNAFSDVLSSGEDRIIILARQGSDSSECMAKAIAEMGQTITEEYPLSFIPSEFWPDEGSVSLREISEILVAFAIKSDRKGVMMLPEHLAHKIRIKDHHLLREPDGKTRRKFSKVPLATVVMDGGNRYFPKILDGTGLKDINPSIDYIYRTGVGTPEEIVHAFNVADWAVSLGILDAPEEPVVAYSTPGRAKGSIPLRELNKRKKRKLDLKSATMRDAAQACLPFLWTEEDQNHFGLEFKAALEFGNRMREIANQVI